MDATQREPFVSLLAAANSLGVPAAWLKAEAQAARVPHLKVGRRILFNVARVERALLDRCEVAEGSAR
jgi:hypothetical protein